MTGARERARALAVRAHDGQRYAGEPYESHLDQVAAVLERYLAPSHPWLPLLTVAAYLHDIVEDTAVSLEEVEASFGGEVARVVGAVTDSPGENRKERKARTYPRIRAAGEDAILLKLADRIANVEASTAGDPDKLAMYRKEWWGFYGALYDPVDGPHRPMWDHLERLLIA